MSVLGKMRQLPSTVRSLLAHPSNQGRPFFALARFLRWQIGSRLVPGPIAVPLTGEIKILAAPGMPGATGAAYLGLHEYAACTTSDACFEYGLRERARGRVAAIPPD